jgi:DNA invertase Pin-like site-specific DNA recombinase
MELDIYTRVSRMDDDRLRSTEGQEQDCRARVAEQGATVGKVHTDPGKSAWNPRVRRPAWDYLMKRLESGATDGVVVFDLARFSRKPTDGERLIAAADNGLMVLDSEGEYDLTSASGKKAFRDQLSAAAYESDRLSTRVKRGKKFKATRGEVDARSSFGFEGDGMTVCEPEAAELRSLAARFLAGESQQSMIKDLNNRGVRTNWGRLWTRVSFRQVMTRPRNAGYIAHNGEVVPDVRLPGEPIFDQLTYDRVVAAYAARRPGRPRSGDYLCSGIAACGLCGHNLNGKARKSHAPYSDGATRRHYWCSTTGHGCGRITVDQRALDDWAGDFAIRELRDQARAEAAARESAAREERRRHLSRESSDIEQTLTELARRLGRQEMSLARHDAASGPLEKRQKEIAAELEALIMAEPEPVPPGLRRISARDMAHIDWLDRWESGSTIDRRAILLMALHGRRIVVSPGRAAVFDPDRVTVA